MTEEAKPKKPRKAPIRSRRTHPAMQGLKRGVWHPQLAGVVKNYPPTQEAYDKLAERNREQIKRLMAEGKWNRRGVPNGWARSKEVLAFVHRECDAQAAEALQEMIKTGELPDDDMGNEAMQYALATLRNPSLPAKERTAAARLLADFKLPKPTTKSEVTVKKAEDFLADLAKE